ncbi:MAG: TonB-dependent receptor [Helicobacteraceae bacterium]|nr:TonB-dependent receptor [Helicobacteraceae bacterium]
MKKTLQLSLLVATLVSASYANNKITLEPLVIESTAIQTNELQAADAIEVYTSQDIENSQAKDLYEFFNTQTSLIAMPSYGNPFSQKLDMRGYGLGDGYQNIVITINGRKLNNIDMIPQLLSSISSESIEKIEIIKSSGIVVGGDGANAGVINISTKKSNNKEISFYGGAYGAFGSSLYLGHSDETLSLNGAFKTEKLDGVRHIDADGHKDTNKLTNGNIDLVYIPNDSLEFRYGALFSKMDVFYGGTMTQEEYDSNPTQQGSVDYGWGPTPSTAAHQKFATNSLNAGVSYFITPKLSLNLDAYHEKKRSEYINYDTRSDYTYDSAKFSIDFKDDFFSLSAGADIFDGERDSHANSFSPANTTEKKNIAGFVMTHFNYADHSFKAGARVEKVDYAYNEINTQLKDDHSLFGAELGYNYKIDTQSSLFVNYSRSYQAPDVDRFFTTIYPAPTFSRSVVFNGFIQPMKAHNYTLGYNHITSSNKFKISAYYLDLQDEIYYYADPAYMASKNTNIDQSYKYGFDLYDKYIVSESFNLILNYNYVQAIIDKERENGEDYSGNKLPGVSNHNAKLTLNYLVNQNTTLALTQVYRSKAYALDDFANTMSQKQDAFKSTDISVKYAKEDYELFAKINNLFNQKNGMWIKEDAIYPINFTTTAIAGFTLKY